MWFKSYWDNLKLKFHILVVKYKSRNTYPDLLTVNFESIFGKQRKLKIAVIDDDDFPFTDALEARGAGGKVQHFSDYTKPLKQAQQKSKPIDLSNYDIIFCDISGVGSSIFPSLEGIGVIDDLRIKYPFHVIVAYTGNPGLISSKLKKADCVDHIFSKDWQLDDFLLNFDKLVEIFKFPKARWIFIRKRLSFLDVGEKEIESFRRSFVEHVLLANILKNNFDWNPEQTRNMLIDSSNRSQIECETLVKLGITGLQITKLITPNLG